MPVEGNQRRGLALPAIRIRGGYFTSRGPLDKSWGDLLNALFIPRGSRAMRRGFGSGLQRLIFDPLTERDDPAIQLVAREAAERMVPSVRVRDIKVGEPVDGTVNVHVTFSPPSDVNAPAEGYATPLTSRAKET
jgi:phage baseplate assembly protein W